MEAEPGEPGDRRNVSEIFSGVLYYFIICRDFWEICEDRYQVRSTILTSQLPVSRWHEQIGDPTLADGILDRLVHNAHRIEMRRDSMRKNRGKANT